MKPLWSRFANLTALVIDGLNIWTEPAQHYCPAVAYEMVQSGEGLPFQINSQNCGHCKICHFEDSSHNITWASPVGG